MRGGSLTRYREDNTTQGGGGFFRDLAMKTLASGL